MDGFDEPDPDSDYDYEESYSKRKKKRAGPGKPGPRGGGSGGLPGDSPHPKKPKVIDFIFYIQFKFFWTISFCY